MRRFLDLNPSSIVFMRLIGSFMVLIPSVLYGIRLLWSETGLIGTLLLGLIKASFTVGALVCVVFLILIVVEQIQDRYFDAWYQEQRSQKVFLGNGYYECQYCGNQRVRENDEICNVCEKQLSSPSKHMSHKKKPQL